MLGAKLAATERLVVLPAEAEDGAPSPGLVLWDWDAGRVRELQIPAAADVGPTQFQHAFVLREGGDGRCEAIAGLHLDPPKSPRWHIWREDQPGVFAYSRDPNAYRDARLDQFAALVNARLRHDRAFPPHDVVDMCWVSAWLAVGISATDVVWVKNGAVMCRFDPWPPDEDGPRVDSGSGAREELVCVAANAAFVCVATSFGRLHVLCRDEMAWRSTLPLGELIVSMAATQWEGHRVATRSADASVRVIDLETAQSVGLLSSALELKTGSLGAPPPGLCISCGKTRACFSVSNQDFVVCRNLQTGETRAAARARPKRWCLIGPRCAPQLATCDNLALLLNNFAVAASNADPHELLVFALTPHKAARVGRLVLTSPCVNFDIDAHKRNRIAALDAAGTVSIFPFRLGDQAEPAVRIKFTDEPRPTMIAAHAGRLAVANRDTLVILLRPGHSAEDFRIDRSFRFLEIRAVHWHGPNCVVLNDGEYIDVADPP